MRETKKIEQNFILCDYCAKEIKDGSELKIVVLDAYTGVRFYELIQRKDMIEVKHLEKLSNKKKLEFCCRECLKKYLYRDIDDIIKEANL